MFLQALNIAVKKNKRLILTEIGVGLLGVGVTPATTILVEKKDIMFHPHFLYNEVITVM